MRKRLAITWSQSLHKPHPHTFQRPIPSHIFIIATAVGTPRLRRSLRLEPSTVNLLQSVEPLRSGLNLTTLGAALLISSVGLLVWQTYIANGSPETKATSSNQPHILAYSEQPLVRVYPGMIAEIPPGCPGNLTSDQEAKLRELWQQLFQLTGAWPHRNSDAANGREVTPPPSQSADASEEPGNSGKKKRRFGGLLGRKKDRDPRDENGDAKSEYSVATSATEDKHGQVKEFKEALAKLSPAELRQHLWEFTKADDPDASLCRYLRARKWNVHDALVMLISTIHWRSQVMRLDADIMKNGEEAALEASRNEPGAQMDKKMGEDFMSQMKMGKSFLHGIDKEGRPMCFVRVRLHRQGEQSEAALERYTVFTIETARFLLRPPVSTAVIVFDMTNFGLANMDYTPVKFMIKVFESNFPESLGAVLVHKAPWVFQGIWSVIRGWLDPVVASKIHFTKDVKELSRYVDMDKIPKELGGEEDWEYRYQEPVPGENEVMKDEVGKAKVEKERGRLVAEYEAATIEWVRGAEVQEKRLLLAERLRANYWALDPYIRSKSLYDRVGIIRPGGFISFYRDHLDEKDADEESVYYDAQEQPDLD